jgi:hypothetical protein
MGRWISGRSGDVAGLASGGTEREARSVRTAAKPATQLHDHRSAEEPASEHWQRFMRIFELLL